MTLADYINKHLAGRSERPTIVGIRHQIGLLGETYWLDDTVGWLRKRVKPRDKVMLEIPEYPLGESFRKNVTSRVRAYLTPLCDFLHERGCEIIPGEDKERWGSDDSYHKENIRDDEVFIPRMREIRPRFFVVGFAHLNYLKEQMPEFEYVSLVDERKDRKTCSWLNIDYSTEFNWKQLQI